MSRIASGGLIDRSKPLRFSFDGQTYSGFQGDTLASALLANDVRLMGRSFKYHRPRGVVTAGSDEPNALMQVGTGAQMVPNTRATVQEIYEGLTAVSQNRYPSLSFDMMQVNDLAAPLLSAGFYYKTFMWPKAFWEKLYEPIIRKAAGLGALSGKPDEEIYDKAYAHCDILVIGAGPAGLMAAKTAAKGGARVILADEDALPGGRLNSETLEVADQDGSDWAAGIAAELAAMPNVRVMTRTTITGAYDTGTFGALERVGNHVGTLPDGAPRQTFWRIAAQRAILAGGAFERLMAFPMNDRPGIMSAAALRTYVNRYGAAPADNIALFINNDDAARTVRDLDEAGVSIAALIDTRPDAIHDVPCRVIAGGQVVGTKGRLGLSEISVRDAHGGLHQIKCEALGVAGGWNPEVHLTCHMNGRPVWRDDIAAFVPVENAVPGLSVVGAANGNFSTAQALRDGVAEAKVVLKDLGLKVPRLAAPAAEDAPVSITPFWHVKDAKGRMWLDFQNDVTTKDVALSYQENFRSVEHMKRYTTLGMATDQGKLSNVGGLAIMAELTGQSIEETGTTTFRPPFNSVELAALGARSSGKGFQPERFTTSHDWALALGAPSVEAGLWYRAQWFPQEGETHWRDSVDREVKMVRSTVGICDVSTLGKIELSGPDVGAFLDLVYTNMFSSLKVGKTRYGLMLREDGIVMDDGTTARLSENHYVMTTTTAGAGAVMSHLDFVSQCIAPHLDVTYISTTESWAQFAVAGPKSRELLDGFLDENITDDTFPFMACGDVTIGNVKGRLFRISFSGEHAYEIAVPARYGDALVRELHTRAEALGGGAYGTEALNVLRIEKGHITHSEIHGRTTAADCGMGRMVSAKKDCIGKAMSERPGLRHGRNWSG